MFSSEAQKEVDRLLSRYPVKMNALLPILHVAQRQNQGHLTPEWLNHVAQICEVTPAHVEGVATFYTMYKFKRVGRYHLQVCTNISCGLCGGEEILEQIEKHCHLHPGETDEAGLFSLEEVECLGACGYAPVLMVNEDYHENMTHEKVAQLLDTLEKRKA